MAVFYSSMLVVFQSQEAVLSSQLLILFYLKFSNPPSVPIPAPRILPCHRPSPTITPLIQQVPWQPSHSRVSSSSFSYLQLSIPLPTIVHVPVADVSTEDHAHRDGGNPKQARSWTSEDPIARMSLAGENVSDSACPMSAMSMVAVAVVAVAEAAYHQGEERRTKNQPGQPNVIRNYALPTRR